VSSIALFELWYGVAKSSRRDFNKKPLDTFFAGPIHPLSFEDQGAEIAGVIRADLQSIGKPICAYELLIAGQAIRNKLTLITANLSEFARIKQLAWADWGRP
jgi:tRNA(fMet)-specific endonuclease VapC